VSCATVCERASAHLLGSRGDVTTDGRLGELLSQTVTVHWLAQVFNDHAVAGIDEYVRLLQQNVGGERHTGDSLRADVTL